MPYGVERSHVDTVTLAGDGEIAVYPEVMKMLELKAGQTVDEETARAIVAANEKFYLAK